MTAMPQMVALFNGLGGGAAALVAFSDYHDAIGGPSDIQAKIIISILFSAVVGSLSFSGSMVAFGKLQEMLSGSPETVPGQKLITAALFAAVLILSVYLATGHENQGVLIAAMVLALILGVQMVLPIGGADMPVVISLLELVHRPGRGRRPASCSHNNVLIIAGTLVGASGFAAHPDDGQGHEPLVRQRHLRRVRHRRRRRRTGRRRRRRQARARASRRRRGRACWPTPAGS